MKGSSASLKAGASRVLALAAVVMLVGMLPWLSGRSPEYTILRARYAELEATPEALAAVRTELGLDRGPLPVFLSWLAGVLRGDLGTSWTTNTAVLPGTVDALGVSLTLMAFSLAVALSVAALLCLPALSGSARGSRPGGTGTAAAALTALPEFLLAAVLLVVGAVHLRWFPPFGWQGLSSVVLPALALGLPAGGLIGRLLADAISAAGAEKWVGSWLGLGFARRQVGSAVLRRALPGVVDQIGLVLIGLTGGAVAVEKVFAIPGLGRATLGAAAAQDIPVLQAGVLALLALAVAVGCLAAFCRRLLLGPAARCGSIPVASHARAGRRRDLLVPAGAAAVLCLTAVAGLLRDPFASVHPRLDPPGWALPFGADASGRDLLARVGHGMFTTIGTAVCVVAVCLVLGLILGLFPHAAKGPVEVANAAPPVLVGILVAAVSGPSTAGAAVAAALVGWAPLAAHASALAAEVRTRPYIAVLPVLGTGGFRILACYILPSVAGPVFRHAMLRLPGTALALAALGFLGLGPTPPAPEWGLILAEGIGYAERAPWAVAAPAAALILLSILAVSLSGLHWNTAFSRQRPLPEPDAVRLAAPAPDALRA